MYFSPIAKRRGDDHLYKLTRKNGFSSLKPGLKTPEESLSTPRQ